MSFDVDRSVTSDRQTPDIGRTNIDLGRGSYTIAPKGAIKKFTVDFFGSSNSSDRPINVASVKRGSKASFYGVGRLLAPRGPRVPS